jgi:hypothetical protein
MQRFSRHKDVRLLQRYDDNRQDLGGAMARRLAEDVCRVFPTMSAQPLVSS